MVDAATAAAGADAFFSHTEVLHGLNMGLDSRLAIVRVDPRGEQYDEVRYLARPFASNEFGLGTDYQHTLSWPKPGPGVQHRSDGSPRSAGEIQFVKSRSTGEIDERPGLVDELL